MRPWVWAWVRVNQDERSRSTPAEPMERKAFDIMVIISAPDTREINIPRFIYSLKTSIQIDILDPWRGSYFSFIFIHSCSSHLSYVFSRSRIYPFSLSFSSVACFVISPSLSLIRESHKVRSVITQSQKAETRIYQQFSS